MNQETIDRYVQEAMEGERPPNWFCIDANGLNEKDSRLIQDKLFSLGFKWCFTGVGYWKPTMGIWVAFKAGIKEGYETKQLINCKNMSHYGACDELTAELTAEQAKRLLGIQTKINALGLLRFTR